MTTKHRTKLAAAALTGALALVGIAGTASADGGPVAKRQPAPTVHQPGPVLGAACPTGTVHTPVEMPLYDKAGMWVIGTHIVWFCLPEDLEPAG